MRWCLRGLAAAALVLGAAGCGENAAEVVPYTSVDQVFSEPIFRSFEKQTGTRKRLGYRTPEEVYVP